MAIRVTRTVAEVAGTTDHNVRVSRTSAEVAGTESVRNVRVTRASAEVGGTVDQPAIRIYRAFVAVLVNLIRVPTDLTGGNTITYGSTASAQFVPAKSIYEDMLENAITIDTTGDVDAEWRIFKKEVQSKLSVNYRNRDLQPRFWFAALQVLGVIRPVTTDPDFGDPPNGQYEVMTPDELENYPSNDTIAKLVLEASVQEGQDWEAELLPQLDIKPYRPGPGLS